jgi:hypothetical protein
MSRLTRFTAIILTTSMALVTLPVAAYAQGRGARPHPTHRAPAPVVRGQVFIGGYFYDPFFGPYPWWQRPDYPYWYRPIYDSRASVRIRVTTEEAEDAAVYVDGFYAGVVDDFNGTFQSLPLPPGGHSLVLYLNGYRTVRYNIYLARGSTFSLRAALEPLPAGVMSEPPELAPPVPPPPTGSYRMPVTPERLAARPAPPGTPPRAVGFGTLDIFIQPATAQVTIDGQRWDTTESGHFLVQVPAGKHRVEISKPGFRPFASDIEVRDGETTPLNVSLMTTVP